MHQPQLKTHLLLHALEDLLQISFEVILETEFDLVDRFFIPTLVQKLSWVNTENISTLKISTSTQDIF